MSLDIGSLALRLLVAALLGAIVGLEREDTARSGHFFVHSTRLTDGYSSSLSKMTTLKPLAMEHVR